MKKAFTFIAAMLFGTASLFARPGYTKPVDVYQPDGTTVTLMMHGDEYLSYMSTTDGYTVVKGDDGYYRYAVRNGEGQLQATDYIAKNADSRTQEELAFLSAHSKMVQPTMSEGQRELKKMAENMYLDYSAKKPSGQRKAPPSIWPLIDYNNFKGLVVLVEFSDRKFTTEDPNSFYQRLTSEENLYDESKTFYPVAIEGSVRDYFRANSMGKFDPTFDVVGPVQIDMKSTDVKGKNFSVSILEKLIKKSLSKVDATVNFANYDLDNNGVIDMIYFVFAGYGSYVQGNNENYLWPHANDYSQYAKYYNWKYDGKYFGRYACSVEIQDYEALASQHVWLDGIGTMCHEFSHVLGLADHYDTDYEENGMSQTPDGWDIMAGGADNNYGLTPVGYNAFERYMLTFADEHILSVAGNYQLEPFATSNQYYEIKTGSLNDNFFIENRQKSGWDRFLPGHGLLIWRADTSTPSVWRSNSVNNKSQHNYFQLVQSVPGKGMNTEYTPFPGKANIVDVTANTTPALKSWYGKEAVLDLYDIAESDEGIITFLAGKDIYPIVTEDFEGLATTTADATDLEGKFCKWSLTNAVIDEVADDKGCGAHVVKLNRSGILESAIIKEPLRNISFKVWNGSVKVRLNVTYRQEGTDQWNYLTSSDGNTQETLAKNATETTFNYQTPQLPNCQIRITMLGTSNSATTYIDDVTMSYVNTETGISEIHDARHNPQPTYNLAGQKVNDVYRGLLINNGKKFIRK